MTKCKYFLVFFLAYILTSPYGLPQKVRIESGVRAVHNTKEGKWSGKPRLSLKLVRIFGGIDTADENQVFSRPVDMALDEAGNLYVLDRQDCRIQKFTQDGHFMATLGRRGQGPGEFMRPTNLDIDAQGCIYVKDLYKIKILTPEGKEQKAVLLPSPTLGCRFRSLKSGQISVGGNFASPKPGEKATSLPKLMQIFDWEGKLQKEFGEIRDYGIPLLNSFANWFFFDVDGEGNFLISFWFQNRIEKYSPEGKLVWRANRVLNFSSEPLSKGKSEAIEGAVGIQMPEMNTVSCGIAADKKGRAWVITQIRQLSKEEQKAESDKIDVYKLEIFDIDGLLLQEIPIQHEAQAIRIKNNQLLILDYSGVRVFQYQIVEK
jgi:hypothetical protein